MVRPGTPVEPDPHDLVAGAATGSATFMVLPIEGKGDSVLIVAWRGERPAVGYVTRSTIQACCNRELTMCDCRDIVAARLHVLEPILWAKHDVERSPSQSTPCVELTYSDFTGASGPRS
jgi:hypothetical protein